MTNKQISFDEIIKIIENKYSKTSSYLSFFIIKKSKNNRYLQQYIRNIPAFHIAYDSSKYNEALYKYEDYDEADYDAKCVIDNTIEHNIKRDIMFQLIWRFNENKKGWNSIDKNKKYNSFQNNIYSDFLKHSPSSSVFCVHGIYKISVYDIGFSMYGDKDSFDIHAFLDLSVDKSFRSIVKDIGDPVSYSNFGINKRFDILSDESFIVPLINPETGHQFNSFNSLKKYLNDTTMFNWNNSSAEGVDITDILCDNNDRKKYINNIGQKNIEMDID